MPLPSLTVTVRSSMVQSDWAVPGVPDAPAPDVPEPPVVADGVPVAPAVAAPPPPDTLGVAEDGVLLGALAADDPLVPEEPEPDAVLELVGPHPAMSSAATATADEVTAVEMSVFRKM